jgi:hypothetical protein
VIASELVAKSAAVLGEEVDPLLEGLHVRALAA